LLVSGEEMPWDGEVRIRLYGTPLPSKFLVFVRIGKIFAQDPSNTEVRGKILLTKDLGRVFRARTEALPSR
jgi:hypothetical protein